MSSNIQDHGKLESDGNKLESDGNQFEFTIESADLNKNTT